MNYAKQNRINIIPIMLTFCTPTIKDLPTLNHISLASKAHWGYPQQWLQHWKDDMLLREKHLTQYNILLAELAGEVVGFCAISEEITEYQVEHLWLLPKHIGKGYGKRLLEQALASFTTTDKPILVEADPHAEAFYQRQGFVTFSKIESYPPGRFLPVMKKTAY
ncbi:MAG: GNAT family N-acetyltransferase [Bacteroidota bacterium]